MSTEPVSGRRLPVEGPVDRAVMARAFAGLFGAGATLVLATIPLASPPDRFLPGMIAPPIVAYGVLALCLTRGAQLPYVFFTLLPPLGAVLITIIAYSAGTPAFHAYALLYFWVVVSAFYFFSRREALPGFFLSAAGYAVVLLHHDSAQDKGLFWVMGAGTLIVTSLLLSQLRDRIDGLLRALRGSDLLKTTIIRSVSHDFRTPLTAIIAAGESSGSATLDPDTRLEISSLIVSEASRLSETLGKLLDMSKLEGGAAEPHRIWCSMEEVVEVAIERTTAKEGFDVEADPQLPDIWADPAQLERALVNVLENSSRFAGDDAVRIGLEQQDSKLVVKISDSGPGLPKEDKELIFEPFWHRHRGGSHRGPGLGLSIARGFVEINGGRIWAESKTGSGTTFVIELPLTAEPQAG